MDAGRDAVGGEHDGRALGDLGLGLDEHRAAVAQLLDHVLVVDDLLAHVDGRAVELERALDRLHGAVDARAVAARGGEQDLLRDDAVIGPSVGSPCGEPSVVGGDGLEQVRELRRAASRRVGMCSVGTPSAGAS